MKKCDCPGDGGPAFPTPTPNSNHGMSLRDWFAGQVLAGILASMTSEKLRDVMLDLADDACVSLETHLSLAALDFADAMLKARNS